MVWYDILEHLIVHFSFSCWLYNERHFLTGSGLKVLHPNFQKGSGIFTFHDERLAFFVCLFKFSLCFFFSQHGAASSFPPAPAGFPAPYWQGPPQNRRDVRPPGFRERPRSPVPQLPVKQEAPALLGECLTFFWVHRDILYRMMLCHNVTRTFYNLIVQCGCVWITRFVIGSRCR